MTKRTTYISQHEGRIRRIAGILGMDWLPGAWVDKYDGRWWLVGTAAGDQPLPNTGKCATLPEALDAAEAWLAPQIDMPECPICHCCHGPDVNHD